MKVSVIIPVYNGGKYILQTLSSVFNQTFKDFDVWVIDDGSEHSISHLLSAYAGRIHYIYKKNTGPAATRNLGIKLSKGEYISLLDHDDVWYPKKLEVQVNMMDKYPECGMVYCYPILLDSKGQIIPNEAPSSYPSGRVFRDFFIRNRVTTFSATLIRRNVFDDVGFLDEDKKIMISDDYDLWLRIADRYEVRFTEGNLVGYRMHDKNLVKDIDQHFIASQTVLNKVVKNSRFFQDIPFNDKKLLIHERYYRMYKKFAYAFYYNDEYAKARKILFKAFCLKPRLSKELVYLFICSLPLWGIRLVKRVKRAVLFHE